MSQNKFRLLFALVIFTGIIGSCLTPFNFIYAATNTSINASVRITICGNNVKETGEDCDGTDLAGKSCLDFGFTGGTLQCLPSCDFNTSNCTTGGGGGGGGGGGYTPPSETKVTFTGKAYPKSIITILKDAQVVATTIADNDADFSVFLTNITSGSYIFSVYSEDKEGNRSSLLTFPLSVTLGVTTNVQHIFIAPTINTDKSEVKKGEVVKIFGQSTPNSDITVIVSSEEEIYGKTKIDNGGAYLYNLDTVEVEKGDHLAKSRATLENDISSLSKTVSFKVGDKTILRTKASRCGKADLNCDGRVNLVDFSIAAYWYKRTLSTDFKTIEAERLNNDAKINLIDFSILAYYWTG